MKRDCLSSTIEHQGPPVKMKQFAENFRKIHKKVFLKKGKLYALVEREQVTATAVINELLKEDYVKSRVRRALLKM